MGYPKRFLTLFTTQMVYTSLKEGTVPSIGDFATPFLAKRSPIRVIQNKRATCNR